MNKAERYEFDRNGFILIPGAISSGEAARLLRAADRVEQYALKHRNTPPFKTAITGKNYHHNPELGINVYYEENMPDIRVNRHCDHPLFGGAFTVEDFFNLGPEFDAVLYPERIASYIHAVVPGAIRLNNSEIRIRYPGNATRSHMGGPMNQKVAYSASANGFNCAMVRVIYLLHDTPSDFGAFCVVPGTHKTTWPSPYPDDPGREPGMIPVEGKAGDAILFTENLRHGGLINREAAPRKTIHVGYGPAWMSSQNLGTMDEPQFVLQHTLDRLDEDRRRLFTAGPFRTEQTTYYPIVNYVPSMVPGFVRKAMKRNRRLVKLVFDLRARAKRRRS